ncbi:potassium transporter TrkG [Nocardia ignorata]
MLFEVVSAFGTVGLSTGITADIPARDYSCSSH